MAAEFEGLTDCSENAFCHCHRPLGRLDFFEKDDELVTPDARDQVAWSDVRLKPLGYGAKNLVADRMAEAVVDSFEAVQVEEDQGDTVSAFTRAGKRRAQTIEQRGSV